MGYSYLTKVELALAVAAWERVLAPIPDAELEAVYSAAISQAEPGRPFGAVNVAEEWRKRTPAAAAAEAAEAALGRRAVDCRYCEGLGWQVVRRLMADGTPADSRRPCACPAAGAYFRTAEPLREPDWVLTDRGFWMTPAEAAKGSYAIIREL